MSYEIIYEKFATKITSSDLNNQIHDFLATHFNKHNLTDILGISIQSQEA